MQKPKYRRCIPKVKLEIYLQTKKYLLQDVNYE